MEADAKPKQKRRSKNVLEGRDFKCQIWGNCYLSYPALQAHVKCKHVSENSEYNSTTIMSTGRGRGRPKKYVGRVTKVNPESDDYFKTTDKFGGPTDPLYAFEEVLISVLKAMKKDDIEFSKYPFYEAIKKFSYEITPGNPETSSDKKEIIKNPTNEYYKLNENDRNSLWWDDIFAVYLWEVSQKVNEVFYKQILKFIICYREWANKLGWDNKLDIDTKASSWESILNDEDKENINKNVKNENKQEKEKDWKPEKIDINPEYWISKNAEQIPEFCNQFVSSFLDDYNFGIDRPSAIDMIRNFCNWLFKNGHTCSKLSMA